MTGQFLLFRCGHVVYCLIRVLLWCMVFNIIGGSCHKYHFCCDKHMFVVTKHIFCRDKNMLVMTNMPNMCLSQQNLSQQTFVVTNCCHDKIMFVTTDICCNKSFVVLSRQAYFCHDKKCVLSWKQIVAAPANDSLFPVGWVLSGPLLQSLIHVSTAYANCDREQVAEQVYDPPLHPRKLIDAVEWVTLKEELVHCIVCHRVRVLHQEQLFHVH